mmetsp:Transcript_15272/g.20227  ORF Transcript_15272/g.20227 Transcript_15272/m.20227 type:complete len:253 (-) Transcript_15272:427-1185(-)|eukprot:CAMPEP_0197289378 /NCGR_PEP_ID=MMETSP0890-20130614/6624_1 /TAXON_ID=44058 ORGANISM="Aureoumbra lagunensis, Strain CCMP1510" /NCGR_SAMPLE_ID=MMETSP0890 /ASSEMBLY_ACC=CAM_ASM_000533 /LENGTH=252 /DNA_ID=CAMNT_0042760743 /DNA_START=28 /DNA_END=786 /DNA_ORIENTATION=+
MNCSKDVLGQKSVEVRKRSLSPTCEESSTQRPRLEFPQYAPPIGFKPRRVSDWRNALREPATELIYTEDDCVRFIYDAFPKAQIHILALPKIPSLAKLDTVSDLRPIHLEHLKQFHRRIHEAAKSLAALTNVQLLIGYHSEPSMALLHCHIISDDFESQYLKTKKHWLSFTTPFLILPDEIEVLLSGRYAKDIFGQAIRKELQQRKARYMEDQLACYRCRKVQSTMLRLKEHIRACNAKHRAFISARCSASI